MAFTYFFRDQDALNLLAEYVVPDLSTRRYMDVWDAGCANGPEPYSIAIVFRKQMGPFLFRNLRIWATDINERFGEIISRGVYSDKETKRIAPDIRERYFCPWGDNGSLQVNEEIRKAVRFQQHDLLSLVPIREQFGLIVCKNVLLHFSPPERVEVIKMFHRALAQNGYFLAERTQELPAETAHLFSRVTSRGQLFRKKAPAEISSEPQSLLPRESDASRRVDPCGNHQVIATHRSARPTSVVDSTARCD